MAQQFISLDQARQLYGVDAANEIYGDSSFASMVTPEQLDRYVRGQGGNIPLGNGQFVSGDIGQYDPNTGGWTVENAVPRDISMSDPTGGLGGGMDWTPALLAAAVATGGALSGGEYGLGGTSSLTGGSGALPGTVAAANATADPLGALIAGNAANWGVTVDPAIAGLLAGGAGGAALGATGSAGGAGGAGTAATTGAGGAAAGAAAAGTGAVDEASMLQAARDQQLNALATGGATLGAAGTGLLSGLSSGAIGAGLGALAGAAGGSATPAGTTTTIQDLPEWQRPFAQNLLDEAQKTYQANATPANLDLMNAGKSQLMGTIGGDYLNANPANDAYRELTRYSNPYEEMLKPTATGSYLNANPYIDATYAKAARGLTDQYKFSVMPQLSRTFGNMQAFGGNSAYNELFDRNNRQLATGLGDLATGIYGQNYLNERGLMQNAQNALLGSSNATQGIRATGAAGLGGNYNTARGQQLTAATAAPGYASDYTTNLWGPLNQYGNLVSRPFGSTTQQPYFNNPVGGALSGALSGYALSSLFNK